jgi:hypothetical protein
LPGKGLAPEVDLSGDGNLTGGLSGDEVLVLEIFQDLDGGGFGDFVVEIC